MVSINKMTVEKQKIILQDYFNVILDYVALRSILFLLKPNGNLLFTSLGEKSALYC